MSQSQPTLHKGGIWHFSEEEKKHLLYATAAFTLALGFMSAGGLGGLSTEWHFIMAPSDSHIHANYAHRSWPCICSP